MNNVPDIRVEQIRALSAELQSEGRYDLLLKGIGTATLEQLCIEAAKATLRSLIITADYRFLLSSSDIDAESEVEMSPLHKALYILP